MSSDTDMGVMTAVLDRIIPPVDDLPGAGGLGLAEEVFERSKSDERFWNALRTVLTALLSSGDFQSRDGAGKDRVLRDVEASHPVEFGLCLDVVYTIYYMQPDVHRWLGWHGRSPQPGGNVMPPWDESVLNTIRQREPFWRKI